MTDERVLGGTTVLIAREPDRAEGLRTRLERCGATVLVAPATITEPGDGDALEAAVTSLDGFDWIVVASVNAVRALLDAARRADVFLARAAVRWAAVGPATTAALEAAGLRVDLSPDGPETATGLVAAFGPVTPGRVLLPQGDLAGPGLADGLRAHGFDVHEVLAYRTVPVAFPPAVLDAWSAGRIEAVVLAAPSGARQVAAQLRPHPGVAGVAIGEPTAAAARAAGLRVDAIAAHATSDALVDALVAALSSPRRSR